MKKLILILLLGLIIIPSQATHYMGGEITWECLPNGNYRFTMKLYRECYTTAGGSAATFGNTEPLQTTVPGLPSITLTRISLLDISPQCNSNPLFTPKIYCPGMANGAANMGALQENIYTSDATYPNGVTLNGIPPPQGWMFYHTSCCRNPCTNIVNSSSLGWRLRAVMYSYNGQNANPCYDNSPIFAEKPSTVICTGYPFTYNHNAYDPDLDSLVYEWAQPLVENGTPIVGYAAGYSYTNPLPGPSFNPNNVPASVDPNTGEVSFTSFTQGAFVTVVKVSTYRCGQLIAEIFREIQVVLLACGNNNPPQVEAPFQDPLTMLYTLYTDTVYAGELVTFSVTGTDFELMPDGITPQTLKIEASGGQFGAGYINPNAGCLYPPCATLNPPPPVIAQFGVITNFSWQTSCEHIATDAGCGVMTNTYTFLIKVMDDFCPAPAINFNTVTIVVLAIPPIDPPEPRCVETLANGDVQITWVPPDDPDSTFNSYHIYYSPNLGFPFQVVDSVFNYYQTSWVHPGANGNNQQGYYYVKTRSGCFGKYWSPTTSDTISNILLNVTNSGTGVAQLNWNAVKDPIISTNSPWYLIYRDPGTGTFNLIDSTLNLFYNDTIVFCNADVRYQIWQADSSGCYSKSNIDGDNFSDVTPPDSPVMDFVTVDFATQKAYMEWQASSASDVTGYIIYRFSGVWSPLDTVPDLFYQDNTGDPTVNYESYRVAAIDSCGNTSPMSSEHRTIFLTTSKDICDDEITLTWTPYINLLASLASYEIYVNENGGAYSLLGTTAPGTTSFIHNGLTDSTQYCYYIRAINDDGTKTPQSNYRCETAIKPFQPQFGYIRYVTVVENNYIEIAMYTDTTAKVAGYTLEKSENGGSTFSQIATMPPSLDPFRYHDDYQVNVDENVYTYRFIVQDSCGVNAIISNLATSILLSGEQGNDLFTNLLNWTEYDGWPTGIEFYDVYRGTDNPLVAENIAQVPAGVGSYYDAFPDNVIMSEGKISYYVQAQENPGNPFGFTEQSMSNIVFVPQPPRVYVPNAFTPEGLNPVFQPFLIFIDNDNYFFAIYDRWGKEIFSTTDTQEGWNGTYEGEYVKMDTYVYVIKARFADGVLFEKRGIVNVIR